MAAALALKAALLVRQALVLILSPTLRQSSESYLKVKSLYSALGCPIPTVGPRLSALKMELANGSRMISLPGSEGTVRGFSGVSLLIVDEASRVPDDLYHAIRPMLAVSGGRLVALSTPFGKRGWWYEAWASREPWWRVQISARQVSRISPEFLAEERRVLGKRWYSQEYENSFEDMAGAVFSSEDIAAALANAVAPLPMFAE